MRNGGTFIFHTRPLFGTLLLDILLVGCTMDHTLCGSIPFKPSLPLSLSLSLSFFWLESMDLHLGFLFFISNFSGPFNFIYLSLNILFPYDSVKMDPTWFFHTPMLSSKTSNDLEWTF